MPRPKAEPVARHHIRVPATLAGRIELLCCNEEGSTVYGRLSQFYSAAAEHFLDAVQTGEADFSPEED